MNLLIVKNSKIGKKIGMKNKKKYQINNISEKQLGVMMDALEMYSRLGLMQFDKLIDHAFGFGHSRNFSSSDPIYSSYVKNREVIDIFITNIKDNLIEKDDDLVKFTGAVGWSLGIGHPKVSMSSKISYEMEKDIDIFLAELKGNKTKGKLKFSNEENLMILNQNNRKEKLLKILEQMKDN